MTILKHLWLPHQHKQALTHILSHQSQVSVEEEGPVQQEATEELGTEATEEGEETFTLFKLFIEVIPIIIITY